MRRSILASYPSYEEDPAASSSPKRWRVLTWACSAKLEAGELSQVEPGELEAGPPSSALRSGAYSLGSIDTRRARAARPRRSRALLPR